MITLKLFFQLSFGEYIERPLLQELYFHTNRTMDSASKTNFQSLCDLRKQMFFFLPQIFLLFTLIYVDTTLSYFSRTVT